MSELSNQLRSMRGSLSQDEVARGADLNTRTVIRAENGEGVTLATLCSLSKYYRLNKTEHATILISWLRQELGEQFACLDIRPRNPNGKVRVSEADRFIEELRGVPRHLQRELARAMKHPELLFSIANLNDLVERVMKEKAQGDTSTPPKTQ